jgi:hypothetical protein
MRKAVCVGLVLLAMLSLAACDSTTEPETPKLKTGASAELAIELPLLFPPPPKIANIVTEWSVIVAGQMWFRNAEETPIDLQMWVTEVRTGDTNRVGTLRLAAFTTKPLVLDDAYTNSQYRDHAWSLKYQAGNVVKTISVGFAR